MKRVAAIVLGGGQGARLFPLTTTRCKPAMCFGGRYRLIDIPISNSLNSGCDKIFIITQFLSSSLHQHILRTYHLDAFSSGFIELLPAEEKPDAKSWFEGTADAVRKNLNYLQETPVDYFLILSGDQLYNIHFEEMLQFARDSDADLVVASLPVGEKEAGRMGILQVDEHNRITSFHEKPQHPKELAKLRLTENQMIARNIDPKQKRAFLGSMGIYLFKRQVLLDLLVEDSRNDFGKHIIPFKVEEGNAITYIYHDYWEDIGTIESFYQANMALTRRLPLFDCYNEDRKIFSQHTNLPGARISDCRIRSSIICEGAVIEAEEISGSIIGLRTLIHKGVTIRDSYVMGNDFYEPPIITDRLPEHFQIGEDSLICKAIIDKNVSIGKNVRLINKDRLNHYDSDNIYIRDGIIVVPRGATIPDNFVL